MKPNFDKDQIMEKYGMGKSCLYSTLKQKESILKMNSSKNSANFKKFNISKNDELETKLTQWIHSENQMGMGISLKNIDLRTYTTIVLLNMLDIDYHLWKSRTFKIAENPSIVEKSW